MGFFNKPTYKQFELKTRYYDREKEELENKKRRWERLGNDNENPGYDRETFKENLKEKWAANRELKPGLFKNNRWNGKAYSDSRRLLVLLLIAAMLIFIIYRIGKSYGV